MKIEITTDSDSHDCETCGSNWASGGTVTVDGEVVIDRPAEAACFGGSSFDEADLLVLALHKLGHEVHVDGERYHITSHDEGYHGPLEGS